MPKVKYTASKGLFQEVGSGIDLTGADGVASLTYRKNIVNFEADGSLLASQSGSLVLIDNTDTGVDITLPAPSVGLHYEFIVVNSDAQATIVTASSANIMKGFVIEAEDAGDAASSSAAGDTITLKTTTVAGDRVSVHCDGINWFVLALCEAADAITVTQES